MFAVELPPEIPKSPRPLGGTPADDRAYLVWRDGFLERVHERHWLRFWHDAADAPGPYPIWRFDGELYRRLGGEMPLFSASAPNYNHRLRWLAIALRCRRREVIRAAERIVRDHDNGLFSPR